MFDLDLATKWTFLFYGTQYFARILHNIIY